MGSRMIQEKIAALTEYGIATGLIAKADERYTINRLLDLFCLREPDEEFGEAGGMRRPMTEESAENALERILADMLDYAVTEGLVAENTTTHRDLFDTRIMSTLVPRPSEVIARFYEQKNQNGAKAATDYFYKLSCDSDYIRRYRIKRDLKWVVETEFGSLDLTINLSKPEKDPKEIAAAKLAKKSSYPMCLLCRENEGYAGRVNHPARQNLRMIPLKLGGDNWYFQYSPYVYYKEHCIVLNEIHTPMKIESATFVRLLDFVEQFPHYFIGSNADLPIVGGSILSHDHFQGGCYEFAMARAEIEREFSFADFSDVRAGIVKWPMSVIRLSSEKKERLIALADRILTAWRDYTDEGAFVYANTNGEQHNTITPIARMRGNEYELDLVLRNNITTNEHPLGVYHPHARLHHIKKENIGLIEVMGLAVLPARLKEEMEALRQALLDGEELHRNPMLQKHAAWTEEFLPKYGFTPGAALEGVITEEALEEIMQKEIGLVFLEVLKDAGVYPCIEEGRHAFLRFLHFVNR